MRLGIDFGTTRIVVAAADRGNYPVLQFESPDGAVYDWFPPLVAARGDERRYGWDAWLLQAEPGWTIIRSLKRILCDAGPETEIQFESGSAPLRIVLRELTASLRRAIREQSNAPLTAGPLEVQLGVPANANTNQRFLTTEAFRWGGFEVLGLLNEPSAASLEYSHNHPSSAEERFILVYDLGGGTFDTSLLSVVGERHEVLSSEGVPTLGGDDFDEMLAELALDAAGFDEAARRRIGQTEWFRLHEECRQKKESVKPNSRKITVDLEPVGEGLGSVAVSVDDYYERAAELIAETMHAVDDALARNGFTGDGSREDGGKLETVYVAGGGSELPLVPRALRDRFGRRVKRSAHGRSSTAIGLALQADATKGYTLRDRFTRYFGVYREAEGGSVVTFDPLFARDTPLPAAGEPPLAIQRAYEPAHNIGHFRYLECSRIGGDGSPAGDVTLWDEILFPLDPALADSKNLAEHPVIRSPAAYNQKIEELYTCDPAGRLSVQISNHARGYKRTYRLGRWAASEKKIEPGKGAKRKASRKRAAGSR
jgi:molecular chaperone DnaK (HSP70)